MIVGDVDVRAALHDAWTAELAGLIDDIDDVSGFIRRHRPNEDVPALGAIPSPIGPNQLWALIERGRALLRVLDHRADAIEAEDTAARHEADRTAQERLEDRLAAVEAENRALRDRLDRPQPSETPRHVLPPLLGGKLVMDGFRAWPAPAGGVRLIHRGIGIADARPLVDALPRRAGLNASWDVGSASANR